MVIAAVVVFIVFVTLSTFYCMKLNKNSGPTFDRVPVVENKEPNNSKLQGGVELAIQGKNNDGSLGIGAVEQNL